MGKFKAAGKTDSVIDVNKVCGCMATRHKFVANCTSCGKIVCERENRTVCSFCGSPIVNVLSVEDAIAANCDVDTINAFRHKDKLILFDSENTKRTHVHDAQADYYESGTWLTDAERRRCDTKEFHRRQKLINSRHSSNTMTLSLGGTDTSTPSTNSAANGLATQLWSSQNMNSDDEEELEGPEHISSSASYHTAFDRAIGQMDLVQIGGSHQNNNKEVAYITRQQADAMGLAACATGVSRDGNNKDGQRVVHSTSTAHESPSHTSETTSEQPTALGSDMQIVSENQSTFSFNRNMDVVHRGGKIADLYEQLTARFEDGGKAKGKKDGARPLKSVSISSSVARNANKSKDKKMTKNSVPINSTVSCLVRDSTNVFK